MLKALELLGFKSFADKTRFEFPPGITVVVGPNGSGKSNVVDAIKWVLGEQSVKSLRGTEMADVIFNGSGGRRALNSAETTLTFDNSQRLLPVDAAEVHVTRRVYRSGEGEYLINGQPCRLRDIRDVFAGTGVSTQAYSIIEQGKVDVLLSASPRDRRLIFEEAAGISRFRAKKIEALRRLERVDQNLLRLSDIVDEVENRLKVVRLQAAKARRYKGYVDRLQELRTQVGLADWRRLSEQLAAFQRQLDAHRAEVAELSARAETAEVHSLELDTEAERADEEIRAGERQVAESRQRIGACESSIEHQRARSRDLEQEIERLRDQMAALSTRAGDVSSLLDETNREVAAGEESHRGTGALVADSERMLTELTEEFDQLRQQSEAHRLSHTDLLRRSGELASETSGLQSRAGAAAVARKRCEQRLSELDATEQDVVAELGQLTGRQQRLAAELEDRQGQWQQSRQRLTALQTQQVSCRQELALLSERHTSARERASVLEELEQRQEGVSSGVKDVLIRARAAAAGPLRGIRGLVADVLRAPIESAPLVEVALGEKAGYLVCGDVSSLMQLLASPAESPGGRVGLVALDAAATTSCDSVDLNGRPGVLARADTLVECTAEFAPLGRRLLGRTWIVEKLAHALELAGTTRSDVNFVTLAGELVAADGTVLIGPRQGGGGLISRRSELRVLAERIAQLAKDREVRQQDADRLSEQVTAEAARAEALALDRERLLASLAELRHSVRAAEERRTQLGRQREAVEGEKQAAAADERSTADLLSAREADHAAIEAALAEIQLQLASTEEQIGILDRQRQARVREATLAKVELAKSEQRLDHLRSQLRQMQQDQHERRRAVEESQGQWSRLAQRAQEAERLTLSAETEVASLFLQKESLAAGIVKIAERREAIRQQRAELTSGVQQLRAQIHKLEAEIHQQELSAGEIRHERGALADRLREDYNIELSELEHKESAEEQHVRAEVEEEISSLRRKISNTGSVNLEALSELETLETRFGDLSAQYRDLSGAKNSLEQIIEKINVDSRRLFSETLETVRTHFQSLFRKLFGGGQADIVLEEEVDILESGLEIVARPPGKEPRSISLLSGGEKTLTCVALLLAIFRSKPSPFCVLDEVDAALDEANIGRFVGVLQEFLAWTQFIVITHSKKTMTCAGTLYGVTMQESGISKRVSVRFEDVSDNGEILRTRDEAAALPAGSPAATAAAADKGDETQAA